MKASCSVWLTRRSADMAAIIPSRARFGWATSEVTVFDDELGFEVVIGEIIVTEIQMVNQFAGNAREPAQFTRGYGLTLGL